jgi:hypothetical protein
MTETSNHGRLWTIDQDQKLMENSGMSNHELAQRMGRTPNAVRYRRNHIAVKLHQGRPDIPIEECVGIMGGDLEQALLLLEQWRDNQASLASFVDNRKRKVPDQERFEFGKPVFGPKPPSEQGWGDKPEAERIRLVCASIREEDGRLGGLWKDPDLTSCLVQHFPGFDAYSKAVQSWAPGGSG